MVCNQVACFILKILVIDFRCNETDVGFVVLPLVAVKINLSGCDAMQSDSSLPIFQRNMVPSFAG